MESMLKNYYRVFGAVDRLSLMDEDPQDKDAFLKCIQDGLAIEQEPRLDE